MERNMMLVFMFVNIVMWLYVILRFLSYEQFQKDYSQKRIEADKKQTEYFHMAVDMMSEMTEMNVSAMKHFIEQMSVKINNDGIQTDETESGK